MVGEVVADRSEEKAGKAPETARTDDEEVCVLGGGEQRCGSIAQRQDAIDLRHPGRVDGIDELIQGLARITLEDGRLERGAGVRVTADEGRVPGHDDL